MARSGYLPDLSGVFTTWRDSYRKAMVSEDWDNASLSLHNMNGALDVDYRIPISSPMWEEKREDYIIWKCNNCTTTETKTINKGEDDEYTKEIELPTCSEFKDIRIYDERCDLTTEILTGKKSIEMWDCPKCKQSATVSQSKKEMMKYPRPHYRSCIYDEPIKPNGGIAIRHGVYPTQMEIWCRNYSIELEHQLAVYRLEYISKMGHDMEDSGYKDDGT